MILPIRVTHIVYNQRGDEKYPDGLVGITIPPLPSCSHTDIMGLIERLVDIANEMQGFEPKKE